MSYYYIFKEENLTAEQNQRLYDLVMELGPRNDVSYAEHIAEIKVEAGRVGFIAGAEMWSDYGVKSRYKDDYLVDIEADASKYAEKIRNGEIK